MVGVVVDGGEKRWWEVVVVLAPVIEGSGGDGGDTGRPLSLACKITFLPPLCCSSAN